MVLLLAVSILLAQATPDVRPVPAKGSISGVVVSATTGEPLRKATVSAVPSQQVGDAPRSTTDANGKFIIEGLAAGHYLLSAERFDYVTLEPHRPGSEAVTVYDGQQVTGLAVKLVPHGSISGRVVDDDGDPWVHGWAGLYQVSWRSGRYELTASQEGSVDERGMFRFGGLRPGRYFLLAGSGDQWPVFPGKTPNGETLQPTWFGGSLEPETAVPINLMPGENRADLSMHLRSGSSYKIQGRLAGLESVEWDGANPSSRPELRILRLQGMLRDVPVSPRLQRDGTFEVTGLRPGTYSLTAEQGTRDDRRGSYRLGEARVEVGQSDVGNVIIPVMAPIRWAGQVILDGDMPEPKSLSVGVEDLDGDARQSVMSDNRGRFVFDQISPGRYFVRIRDAEERSYLKRVEVGGSVVESGIVELRPEGTGPLGIVISSRGAALWGQLKRPEGTGAVSQRVWLVPEIAEAEIRNHRVRSAAVDQNGTFWMRNIAPGSYKAYSWDGIPEDAWKNPEFLDRMNSRGLALKLEEGQQINIEVQLVPAAETAGLLAELGMTP